MKSFLTSLSPVPSLNDAVALSNCVGCGETEIILIFIHLPIITLCHQQFQCNLFSPLFR